MEETMVRIPTHFKRRYRHLCKADNNQEKQIPEEICPVCGQRGEFAGFFQGMFTRMGQVSKLLGMPSSGVHLTYLPKMSRTCETCQGEGIVRSDDFDYDCPECDGTGGILILSQPEMERIRRWANARHARWIIEQKHPARSSPHLPPENPIITRDTDAFVKGIMDMVHYEKKYGNRNERIGKRLLSCNDQGWEIFMDLIENWADIGGGLVTLGKTIALKDGNKHDSIVLVSLCQPSNNQPQGIMIKRDQIQNKYGVEAEQELWKNLHHLQPTLEGWIPVNEQFTLEDSKKLLTALIALVTQGLASTAGKQYLAN
jgi:hypothetical protein